MPARLTFKPRQAARAGLLMLHLLALSSCGGASGPAAAAPEAGPGGEEAFVQTAGYALLSYLEADASFADSQMLAGQSFATNQLPDRPLPGGPAGPAELPPPPLGPNQPEQSDGNDLDLPPLEAGAGTLPANLSGEAAIEQAISAALESSGRFEAARAGFDRAAGGFSSQLLGAEGIELDARGGILVNPYRLRATLRSALHANAELSNPSLDLEGRLDAGERRGLGLRALAPLGYLASGSQVLSQADGAETMLLSYRHPASGQSQRVRVTSRPAGELYLRLEASVGLIRSLGLRERLGPASAPQSLSTELTLETDQELRIELAEQRFTKASGSGAGFGSFLIQRGKEPGFGGSLRSLSTSDSRLMLMLEPSESRLGRLMLQQTAPNRATLVHFDQQGQFRSSRQIDLPKSLPDSLQAL